MDDINTMFSHLLGEMDHLSQSLMVDPVTQADGTFSIGFTDLNESLNELEDGDLDDLVADLHSKPTKTSSSRTDDLGEAHPPPPDAAETSEAQTKADKIKLALEKLAEAKVRKLIVKVLMSDGGSKTLMVNERQTAREVLDKLFEKTHCDGSIEWSLCETNPELHIERGFEDHEYIVEPLSAWTRHTENRIHFVPRPQKYVMFTDPQLFYMRKKEKARLKGIHEEAKQLLIKEHFGGSAVIVPDLEGTLYLKENGRKVWKPRYFVLRASGLYFVPKRKTKSSTDLACFVSFEKVNVYVADSYRQKYRAPTDFCFILKHPFIQKESHYTHFLCCEDAHTLLLWVNSIRIAKYGTVLYENYQAALKRASRVGSLLSATNEGSSNGLVEDFPHELPPDFLPPPPPPLSPPPPSGLTQV